MSNAFEQPVSENDVDEVLGKAGSLIPLLAQHAAEVDRTRTIPDDVIQAIADAGLFKLAVPRQFGGFGASVRTQIAVSSRLARGCSSSAWVTQNINAAAALVSKFGYQAQADIWGTDPDARVCGAQSNAEKAERVDGGWCLTGRWGYLSGVLQSQWAHVNFLRIDTPDAPPIPMTAVVPLSDGQILDTWHVAGMRGTASNTLVLNNVFVPDHRTIEATSAGLVPSDDETTDLRRPPMVSMLMLILTGSTLGMAKAALDYVVGAASKRTIAFSTYASQSESAVFQTQVAQAAFLIDSAKLMIETLADRVDEVMSAPTDYQEIERAYVRGGIGYATGSLTEAVQMLMDAHGTSGFAESSPLQRIWRDLNVACRHGMLLAPLGYEAYGKALLGRAEKAAVIL